MFANTNEFTAIAKNGFEDSLEESILINFNRLKDIVVEIGWEIEKLNGSQTRLFEENFDLHDEVRNYEIKLIEIALKKTKGSQAKAIKLLGIKKSTLNAKIKRFNISAW